MPLSFYGERKIAEAMYHRGKNFLAASVLLQREGGYGYVVLHLMCQGIEIILKAFLLLRDYGKYKKRLRTYGHNLLTLSEVASSVYGLDPLREPVRQELDRLNNLYQKHVLRYADIHDIFLDPETSRTREW